MFSSQEPRLTHMMSKPKRPHLLQSTSFLLKLSFFVALTQHDRVAEWLRRWLCYANGRNNLSAWVRIPSLSHNIFTSYLRHNHTSTKVGSMMIGCKTYRMGPAIAIILSLQKM